MTPDDSVEQVAVVGMACRLPGAPDLDAFWGNLRAGVESITRFSRDELLAAGVPPDLVDDPSYVPALGTLRDIELFDAGFFGYSAREAAIVDPQQRLFLECAWEALEHAGHDSQRFDGRIGVFGGVGMSGYLLRNLVPAASARRSIDGFLVEIGNDKDYVATRVAYKLDLRGPSATVQTACSTSLVAVHLACQALLTYQCDLALAGGCSLAVPPVAGYPYQQDSILSPDGHCRSYDADGRGTVPGSGAGVVVLRRLSDAAGRGDTVWAAIRGSAVNNDGAAKIGYTAPSVEGQAEVIAEALAAAGVEPGDIGYVEGHGTATRLGDPIEIRALGQVFGHPGPDGPTVALGSVKSNLGHLDTAAGVAGLIKTVLALHHGEIPPSLHFERPNPVSELGETPFFVNTRPRAWPRGATPRRAGVSSFGIGGANAHVVLEEASPPAIRPAGRGPWLLPLSARTAPALERAAANLARHLRERPDQALADVAHTLQLGRRQFERRAVVVAGDREEAAAALSGEAPGVRRGHAVGEPAVTFLFPGQGAQHVGMGRALYEGEPVFRDWLDRACEVLRAPLGTDLRTHLYPAPDEEREAAAALRETRLAQPALFAVSHALAQLWMRWGVRPAAMIGHSVGEYVAACLAGVLSFEDGLRLVAERGRLMQATQAGAMVSVALAAGELAPRLPAGVEVAAVNAPDLCVASGPPGPIEDLERRLTADGVSHTRLHTSHAFHSALLEPMLGPFAAEVARAELRPPRLRYVANPTGEWITAAQAQDPSYWTAQLRQPVQFARGLATAMAGPGGVLLEVGPGTTLTTLAGRQPGAPDHVAVASMGHPGDRRGDRELLLLALGRLWLAGAPVDWAAVGGGERRRRVPLPTYPFQRERHWIEPAGTEGTVSASGAAIPATGAPAAVGEVQNGGAPAGLEEVIEAVWRQHLGVERPIGPSESFFELGGHSLIAVGLAGDLRERLGRRVTLGTVFDNPTIAQLAAAIRELERDELEQALAEVERLSDEEVEAALAAAAAVPRSRFDEEERAFLGAHEVGRLATVGRGGLPHVVPVNYRWNPELDTIEIGGHRMGESLKFRHVQASGRAAFVVDDLARGMPRSIEVRGRAEAVGDALIRIHPERIAVRGLDGTAALRSRRAAAVKETEEE
jgi:PPOX class F420-dependent enzyme/OxyR family protein